MSPRIFMTMTMTMNSDGSEMGSNGPMGQWANGDGFPNESVYEQLSWELITTSQHFTTKHQSKWWLDHKGRHPNMDMHSYQHTPTELGWKFRKQLVVVFRKRRTCGNVYLLTSVFGWIDQWVSMSNWLKIAWLYDWMSNDWKIDWLNLPFLSHLSFHLQISSYS